MVRLAQLDDGKQVPVLSLLHVARVRFVLCLRVVKGIDTKMSTVVVCDQLERSK